MKDCDIVEDCCRINTKLDSRFVDLTISFTLCQKEWLYGREETELSKHHCRQPLEAMDSVYACK